jgi:putative membrane protein
MIGQVAHRSKTQHERGPFQLVRFVMVCCAADVQPVAVLVQYPNTSPDFELMSWVRVIGKVRFETVGDHREPVVDASKVTSIPQPADQYLY